MQIIAEPRVRAYELTYLIPGTLASDVTDSVVQAIKALCKKHKVKILSEEEWGKRQLAYPIKYGSETQREATYEHLVLEADASTIQKFERDVYLNQEVIRHLLVLHEEMKTAATPETAQPVEAPQPVETTRPTRRQRSTN